MKQAGNSDKFVFEQGKKISIPHIAIKEHIGIICRHWCRKNKIEISWIAWEGTKGEECNIVERIYQKYLLFSKNPDIEISTYNNYKNLIIKLLSEFLCKGFKEFNYLLVMGDNKTWKLFDKTMKNYTWKWALNKGLSINDEDINESYYSALCTLFEKLSTKNMAFENSCELKSYYFRILENKMMEKYRMNRKSQIATSVFPELFNDDSDNENDELLSGIKRMIRELDYNERYILMSFYIFEKKLTEIAADLSITPENCRIIKHRTMNRLTKTFSGEEGLRKILP